LKRTWCRLSVQVIKLLRLPLSLSPLLAVGTISTQEAPRPNRHPLLSIFPEPLPDGRTSIALEAANQFLRPDFEMGGDGRGFARFDGEDWGLTLDLAKRFGSFALNLRLRGIWRSGGWADQAFASWHSLLGVPQGGRGSAPKFRLEYYLLRDGRTIAQLDKDRFCTMDADFALLYIFGDGASGGRIGASVQAPTGSRDDFSGSGGWDELLGAALWHSWGRFRLHAQAEYAFLGISAANPYSAALTHHTQTRGWVGAAYQGRGRGFFGGLGLDITIGYTESPYSMGISRIDRSGWQQHWTFSHTRLPEWRFGFSEEAGTYFSPDLTGFVQYRF
jgi:hypothetical protein